MGRKARGGHSREEGQSVRARVRFSVRMKVKVVRMRVRVTFSKSMRRKILSDSLPGDCTRSERARPSSEPPLPIVLS